MSSYPAPNPSPPPLGIYNEQNWFSKSDPTGPVGPQGVQGGLGPVGVQGFQGRQGLQGGGTVGGQGPQGFQGFDSVGTQGNQGFQGTAGGGGGGGSVISINSAATSNQVVFNDGGQKSLRQFNIPALATDGDFIEITDYGFYYITAGATTTMTVGYAARANNGPFPGDEKYVFQTSASHTITGFTNTNFHAPYSFTGRFTRTSATTMRCTGTWSVCSTAFDSTLNAAFDPSATEGKTYQSSNIRPFNIADPINNIIFFTFENNGTVNAGRHRCETIASQSILFEV